MNGWMAAFASFVKGVLGIRAPSTPVPLIGFSIFTSRTGWTKPMDEGNQEMTLNRMVFTDKSTQGELWIDGKMFCYTLEPTCRSGPKVPDHTAIPSKRYLVNIQYSNKFGKKMPFLVDVPNFDGIMIHPGNFPADTHGCILVGDTKGTDYIGESRAAFDRLWPIILDRTDNKMLFITILGGRIADA